MAAGNSPAGCPRHAAVNLARTTLIAALLEWGANPAVATCDLNDEVATTFRALQKVVNSRQIDPGAVKDTTILRRRPKTTESREVRRR
jgi:hypothetical protein